MVRGIRDADRFNNFIRYYLEVRKTKKRYKFYKVFVRSHKFHKDLVEDIIINIKDLGYWKDYMFLLLAGKNFPQVREFIYNFLHKKLLEDIERYNSNEQITTLAKWLPRENSSFDKKIKFVNVFSNILFPGYKNSTRKKKYRQLVSKLCNHINIAERDIPKKTFSNINFHQLPYGSFRKNYKIFIKEDSLLPKVKNYIYRHYIKYDVHGFFDKAYKSHESYDDIHKESVLKAFEDNKEKYYNEIVEGLKIDLKPKEGIDILVRLDKDIFTGEKITDVLSVLILLYEFNDINIIVSEKAPYILDINGDIFEIFGQINMACGPYHKNSIHDIKDYIIKDKLLILDTEFNRSFDRHNHAIVKKYNPIHPNKELLDEILPKSSRSNKNYYMWLCVFLAIILLYLYIFH